MRIIAGSLRSRELILPKNLPIRPTSSKVRAQVFNIAQNVLENAIVLDIFAGSGAIGIEALSRGATHCSFVESNIITTRILRENVERLHLSKQASILHCDAFKSIHRLARSPSPFSFIYIDPPYDLIEKIPSLLEQIDTFLPMQQGAYLFVEARTHTFFPPELKNLILQSSRISGDTQLWHFVTFQKMVTDGGIKSSLPPPR